MRDKIFIITNKKAYLFRFFYEKNDIIKLIIKNIMIENNVKDVHIKKNVVGNLNLGL